MHFAIACFISLCYFFTNYTMKSFEVRQLIENIEENLFVREHIFEKIRPSWKNSFGTTGTCSLRDIDRM